MQANLLFLPSKKYTLQQVEKDYALYQEILQGSHPGLYWYNDKKTIDECFSRGAAQLKDSMTEFEFKRLLSWVTANVHCGHTSVRYSKNFSRFLDTLRTKIFPLSMKVWPVKQLDGTASAPSEMDTVIVSANLNRRDSIFTRGTQVKGINGRSMKELLDTMCQYISSDGYNYTHKCQTLSNRGYFGNLYTSIFGLSDTYAIDYLDGSGQLKSTVIPVYNSRTDTSNRAAVRMIANLPQPSRKERKRQELSSVRVLKIDSANHTAFMDLNSFGRGYRLKFFFRHSFRALRKNQVDHLIIDVRSNGGGSVTNSTFLSRFISDHRFKIADSLYAIRRWSPYGHYIQNDFWNRLFMTFLTRKRSDGNYHFGYFERHRFKPKNNNHFDGKVYIMTGGNSFSATTIFASSVIRQDNVFVVGEETGGGAYGNTAWLIPDVTLPETEYDFVFLYSGWLLIRIIQKQEKVFSRRWKHFRLLML